MNLYFLFHFSNGYFFFKCRSHLNGANNDETKVPRPTKRSKSKIYVSNVPEEVVYFIFLGK